MKPLLNKIADKKFILPALFISLFINIFFFRSFTEELAQRAGEPLEVLDLRTGYTLTDVHTLFTQMGEAGRERYSFITGVVDMIYPIAYGVLFMGLLALLIRRINPQSKWIFLSLVPLGVVGFDYAENISTLHLLKTFPNLQAGEVAMGSMFTQAKWGFMLLYILILISVLIFWLGRKYFRKD